MNRTPDFRRLRKALLREGEPDFVPLMEFHIHPDIKDTFLRTQKIIAPDDVPGRKMVEREVCFWCNAGYDYVPIEISLRRHPPAIAGTEIAAARESMFLNYTRGRGSRGWVERVKGIVSSTEDFKRFPWPKAEELDYSPLAEIEPYLPPSVKVIVQPGRLFQGVWAFMGFEHFCYTLEDNPGLAERCFEVFCDVQTGLVRNALQFPSVGAVWLGDDIAYKTGLMLAPRHFRRHLFPWYRRIGELCRAAGVPLIFHSDGNIAEAMEDLIACGIQAIHPVEPACMDIAHVKRDYGDRLGVIGNIDLSYTLTRGTPQDVDAAVKEKIALVAPGGGYCIGSENSIPDYVPWENYESLRSASLRYGRYPMDSKVVESRAEKA